MNEIMVSDSAAQFLPVMPIAVAVQRRDAIVEFTKKIMVKDTDFGVVPGTGNKPTLLKPGAEKLCYFFGMAPMFIPLETTEDWTGKDHDGEAFFLYRYRCELYRNGVMVGSGIGSCNSWESKYRYRKADRVCPQCGKPAIIRGQEQYGGGWLCFKKKDGCGAKFNENDPSIINQPAGKIANPDPADIVNTIDKMAQKRALVAATLISVNASEFFTQDIEDMGGNYVDAQYTVSQPSPPPVTNGTPAAKPDNPFTDPPAWVQDLIEMESIVYGENSGKEAELCKWVSGGKCSQFDCLTQAQADKLMTAMRKKLKESTQQPATVDMESTPEMAH